MADKKISALTAASVPLAGSEVLPIVQSGATVKVSVDNLTTGKVVPADGVKFPSTQVTSSDPNTLDDYEEGTWTPTDNSGAGLTITNNGAAKYTKIGNRVDVRLDVTYPVTVNGLGMSIGGLPFSATTDGGASIGYTDYAPAAAMFCQLSSGSQGFRMQTAGGSTLSNATVSGRRFQISATYFV